MICQRSPRRGVSIVEITVVMAIMATLAALAVGAYSRLRSGQTGSATEATLNQINSVLDGRYTEVVNRANRATISTELLTYAGNDNDRARSVLIYAYLTKYFPTSFAEATTDFTIDHDGDNGATTPRIILVRHLSVFDPPGLVNAGTAEEQSAACLYMILTTGTDSVGGTFDQQTGQTDAGRVLLDGWNSPIAFTRLTYTTEINNAPWANTRYPSRDPIDFNGKIGSWTAAQRTDFWSQAAGNHIAYTGQPATWKSSYPGTNWVMSTISGGADGQFGNLVTDPGNYLSFRLRRTGEKAEN